MIQSARDKGVFSPAQRECEHDQPKQVDGKLQNLIRGVVLCVSLGGATFLRFNDSVLWCPGCVGCLGLARLPDTLELLFFSFPSRLLFFLLLNTVMIFAESLFKSLKRRFFFATV